MTTISDSIEMNYKQQVLLSFIYTLEITKNKKEELYMILEKILDSGRYSSHERILLNHLKVKWETEIINWYSNTNLI